MSSNVTQKLNKISPKIFWSIFAILLIGFVLISFANQSELSDSTRAERISKQLRCIECEGLSVAESNTPTSKSIVRDVERRVNEGQSDAEIFQYYEGIYGEFIRLAPTASSGNWIVYVIPIFGVAVLSIAVFLSIRKSTSKKLTYGFWGLTAIVFIGGVIFFVNDARSNDNIETVQQQRLTSEELEKLVNEEPSAENYRNLALMQFDEQNYVDSFINFSKAIDLDGEDIMSRAYSSNILLRAEQYSSALTMAESAVQIDSESHIALYFRGIVYALTPEEADVYEDDFADRAKMDLDKVLELAPQSIYASEARALYESLGWEIPQ